MSQRLRPSGRPLRVGLAAVLGAVLGAAVLVHARSEITRLRYRLGELVRVETALREEVEKLRIESAVLTAPEQLEPRARALGLRYPAAGQLVRVERSRVVAGAPRPEEMRAAWSRGAP